MRDKDNFLLEEAYTKVLKEGGVGGAYRYPVEGEIEDAEYALPNGSFYWISCKWEAGLYPEGEVDENSILLDDLRVSKQTDDGEDIDLTSDFDIRNEKTIVSNKYPELAKNIDTFVGEKISEYVSDNFSDFDIEADIADVAADL